MVTGIGAALVHEGVQYLQVLSNPAELFHIMRIPTVGASGSVFGLLLAYGMLFPNNIISLIIPPISLKAKWFVLIYGAIEFFFGITGTNQRFRFHGNNYPVRNVLHKHFAGVGFGTDST